MMTKLDVRAFGLVLGCVWGTAVFVLGMVAAAFHRGVKIVELFSKVYIGYRSTPAGCLIGAVWGFVDGMISGLLIAWVYNRFVF